MAITHTANTHMVITHTAQCKQSDPIGGKEDFSTIRIPEWFDSLFHDLDNVLVLKNMIFADFLWLVFDR